MKDTSDNIQELYSAMIMQKTGEERLIMGVSMCQTAKRMVLSSFPDKMNQYEIRCMLLRRYYSNDFSEAELKKIEKRLEG